MPQQRTIATAFGFSPNAIWAFHGGPMDGDTPERDLSNPSAKGVRLAGRRPPSAVSRVRAEVLECRSPVLEGR